MSKPPKFLISILILFLFVTAFYVLSLRLVSRLHYHRAKNLLLEKHYGLAAGHLEKAVHYQPNDDKLQKELGKVNYKLGELRPRAKKAFLLTERAKDHLISASRLNPLDAETAYRLARGEARLKQLYQYLHPEEKNNPYQPLPYFKQAIRLRPNGILYRYAMARYLYSSKKEEELLSTVRTLSRIYPRAYYHLKKEAFWSPPVKEAVKLGLQEAVEEEISLKEAHMAISSIRAGEKAWPLAISHYREALRHKTFQNGAGNYIHLGRLYLKNRDPGEAEISFFKALDLSRFREKDLERLYHLYKNEGYPEELNRFYQQVSRQFILSSRMDILLARSLIDLKQYNQAQRILKELNEKDPRAEAYYWLARIAETDKDWDTMELAIQKATLHDPKNSRYHLTFSQALKRQKKLERAEKEAMLALKHAAKPNPWLFNHRAWLRWSRKDYTGAIKDWQKAIKLKPERPAFYAQTAEAYKKLRDKPLAMDYYKKALNLDPNNTRYQKSYQDLKAENQK